MENNKIALLFAGQGAQTPGMAKDLYESSAAAKAVFDMGELIHPGVIDLCFNSDMATLSQTQNTQPALFLCDLACAYALIEATGITPDFATGFSLGEIASLAYCGVLSNEQAFELVCLRGVVMAECAEKNPGSMAAVLKLSAEQVRAICDEFTEVYPVNYNCPGQIAVAGNAEQMKDFCTKVKENKGRAVPLPVSGAFHSPYMKDASVALAQKLAELDVKAPQIPMFSNLSATLYPQNKEDIINSIAMQASSPVRFEEIIKELYASGVRTFIEVGAGKTLSGFVGRTLEDVTVLRVSGCESLAETIEALKGNA